MIANYSHIFRKSFTFYRVFNLIRINLSYFLSILLKKPIVWGYPPKMMIEPTNICNLKCPLCPSGADKLHRNRGYMSFELYKKIIDQIQKHCFVIYLWNQGEPFLHKDIIKMIEYANSKRISVVTSTNANILPDPKALVQSGLESMVVSLDGTTQATYNKYRVNGSIKKVYENIQTLSETKSALKKSKPTIVCQFIVMKHNEHEVDEFSKLDLGTDEKIFKTVQIYSKEDIDAFLPNNPKYRRYKIINDDFIFRFKIHNRCYRLWNQPVINWGGEISLCCFDKDNLYKIGNLKEKPFEYLWRSTPFMEFRGSILKNRKMNKMCQNCDEGLPTRFP